MKISSAFPSEYLKAADLQDRNVRVVMSHVEMKEVGDDRKPILYFQSTEKGLVLNKTNANNIAIVYGDDTDDWIGKELVLFPTLVDYQGRSVEAIRVRPPAVKDRHQSPAAPPPQQSTADDMDDVIPF